MDVKPRQLRAKKDTLVGAGLKLEPLESEGTKSKVGPPSISTKPPEDIKLPGDNLDQAEDDSQIALHENGPEGKEEILDDDQNPDGQVRCVLVTNYRNYKALLD